MSIVIDFFVRMRRLFFVFVMILTAGGCSALLGLEERPIDDGFLPDTQADPPDRIDTTLDVVNSSDALIPDSGAPLLPLIPCLLASDGGMTQERAFFCDDFESAAFKPQWTKLLSGDGGVAKVDRASAPPDADLGNPNKTRARSGQFVMASGFDPIPAEGDAFLRYTNTDDGPISVRFQFELQDDDFVTGRHYHVASLTTTDDQVMEVYFQPTNNSTGDLFLQAPGGNPIQLAPMVKFTWVCLQITYDGTTLYGGANNQPKGNSPYPGKQIKHIDFGYKGWMGSMSGNSRFNDYENVVISRDITTCD